MLVREEVVENGRIRICRRLVSAADARDPKSLAVARRRYVPRLMTSSRCSRLSALLVLWFVLLAWPILLPASGSPPLASSCSLLLAFSCFLLLASFSSPPAGPSSWLLSRLSLGRSLRRIS